ncbi:hypothetical protein F0562_000197 [Nyssa sinensis]|uniref:Uncharacterized protein n=1 Tax=Nyssa sinensis TaxID=561372 RepID=A0A5J5C0V3_9ASTE|nr:hypothetical protein F0562_000197 [Nyssa sinensis]
MKESSSKKGSHSKFLPKLCKGAGTVGQGMIITLHADQDPFPNRFLHAMREIAGQAKGPQGDQDLFPGPLITGQTAGPQVQERLVGVPYDERDNAPSRSQSPMGNARSPSRSRSRSYSPR